MPTTRSTQQKKSNKPSKRGIRSTVKDQSGAGKVKIGEILSKAGYITQNQFEAAKAEMKKTGKLLSHILIEKEYIDDDTIPSVLNRLHNYEVVNLAEEAPSPDVLKLVPYETAKQYMAFPLRMAGNILQITMAEPTNDAAVEELQNTVQKELTVCVSKERDIIEAYRKYYEIDDEEYKSFFGDEAAEEEAPALTGVEDFGALVADAAGEFEIEQSEQDESVFDQFGANDAPIIKLVNGILVKAIQDGISDIHVEPFEKNMQVRLRKDGSLFKSMNLPLTIKNALTARIKILADLDITERRVPQDGRIKITMGRNRAVDFRVSTLPTLWGEGIVMRILDKSNLNVDLTKLGFEESTFAALKRCLSRPQGMLLVTGPTGSGKTVTLYSALNSLNSEDIKILTAEDPVEFNFKGINQVNVNEDVGMTFAAALKAFLRQDPDIIMVGEIRDIDTAEIAIKAAMTGHLVFSTLHTNDCAATIGRMVDIGIPPYMLASSLTMVLSQRLGRRLCNSCKMPVHHSPDELKDAGFEDDEIEAIGKGEVVLYGPKGCPDCNGLGYKGRVGFFELMEVTETVAAAISSQVPEDQLRKIAIQQGMFPLRRAALNKAKEGITSLEEVLRRTVLNTDSMPPYLLNPDVEEYRDGDIIVREGNTDNDFFKLVRGTVAVFKGKKKIGEITEPGEYFGEMSAIIGGPRSASLVSQGRSTVIRYPGDKFMEIVEKYPDIAKIFFRTMARRIEKSQKIITKLADSKKAGGRAARRPRAAA